MPARRLAAFLDRHGIHYAWVVVAVTFLVALTTAGAVGIPGALILPMSREFGWDTAETARQVAAYRAAVLQERTAAELPETALDASLGA